MVSHQTTTNTEKSKQFLAEANTSEVANFQYQYTLGHFNVIFTLHDDSA